MKLTRKDVDSVLRLIAYVSRSFDIHFSMRPNLSDENDNRVPRDLRDRIEKAAEQQGVSMNQFAVYAFTREISSLEAASFFQSQYAGKSGGQIYEDFDAVMKKVSEGELPDWNRKES